MATRRTAARCSGPLNELMEDRPPEIVQVGDVAALRSVDRRALLRPAMSRKGGSVEDERKARTHPTPMAQPRARALPSVTRAKAVAALSAPSVTIWRSCSARWAESRTLVTATQAFHFKVT